MTPTTPSAEVVEAVDTKYYRDVAAMDNLLGGEDSLRKEIVDLCDEVDAYLQATAALKPKSEGE